MTRMSAAVFQIPAFLLLAMTWSDSYAIV